MAEENSPMAGIDVVVFDPPLDALQTIGLVRHLQRRFFGEGGRVVWECEIYGSAPFAGERGMECPPPYVKRVHGYFHDNSEYASLEYRTDAQGHESLFHNIRFSAPTKSPEEWSLGEQHLAEAACGFVQEYLSGPRERSSLDAYLKAE